MTSREYDEAMNVFQQLWQNWQRAQLSNHPMPAEKQAWTNELNQAVFKRLEKNLPGYVKVRTVTTPAFLYWTEAAGGYGVDSQAGVVHTRNIMFDDGTFEQQVESAAKRLQEMIEEPGVRTVFFYWPIVPYVRQDGDFDRPVGKIFARVRYMTTGETVDVDEGRQASERNT